MSKLRKNTIIVSGHPSELRAFAVHLQTERQDLVIEYARETDPDRMNYDAVTALIISAVGGLASRLAYDALVSAWNAAKARNLVPDELPTEPKGELTQGDTDDED